MTFIAPEFLTILSLKNLLTENIFQVYTLV